MKSKYLTLLLLLYIFTACSSDDESDENPTDEFGEASFSVSGNVEGEKSGVADFHYLQDLPGDVNSWSININDYGPQTFSLSISFASPNPIAQPEPGTYEIGFAVDTEWNPLQTPVFLAIYTDIDNGDFSTATEYSTLPESSQQVGGTLTITSSTSETIQGSFHFQAANVNDMFEVVGTVELTGEFTAKRRVGN